MFYMIDVGYYCPKCNKIYNNCYELQGILMCFVCWSEDVKLITLNNFKLYPNMKLRKNVLDYFKKKYKNFFTEKEKK